MKPGGVVVLKRISFLSFFGKNRLLLLMLLCFLAGVIISSVSFSGSRAAEFSNAIFGYYISLRKNTTFLKVIFSVFSYYLAFFVALFIAGSSLTGVVLSPVICCTSGLYFGSLISYTYSSFALKGIAFNSVIIIPPALIVTLCMLFAAKESFSFSLILLKTVLPKSRPVNLSAEFKTYCGKYLLSVIFSLVAAVADAAVSGSFIKYFSFV